MKETTLKFLERNLSSEPSTFVEEAKWRQDNEVWLKWSQGIAMKIIDYMQEHKLSRADIAARLGVHRSMSAKFFLDVPISLSRVLQRLSGVLAYTSWKLLLREVKDRDFLKEYSNDENYRL